MSIDRNWRPFAVGPWGPRANFRAATHRNRLFKILPGLAPNLVIAGVTRDNVGAPLGNCTVDLFITATDAWVAQTISDGSGNWSLPVYVSGPFFARAYLAGSPDRAGTTLNTLDPVQV